RQERSVSERCGRFLQNVLDDADTKRSEPATARPRDGTVFPPRRGQGFLPCDGGGGQGERCAGVGARVLRTIVRRAVAQGGCRRRARRLSGEGPRAGRQPLCAAELVDRQGNEGGSEGDGRPVSPYGVERCRRSLNGMGAGPRSGSPTSLRKGPVNVSLGPAEAPPAPVDRLKRPASLLPRPVSLLKCPSEGSPALRGKYQSFPMAGRDIRQLASDRLKPGPIFASVFAIF